MSRSHYARAIVAALCGGTLVSASAQEVPPPDISRNLTLQDYRNQADTLLPPYNTGLLTVPPGPDWLAPVDVSLVSLAVNDTPPPEQVVTEGPLTEAHDAADTKFVKIDRDIGRVRWGNKTRRFDVDTSPHVPVPETTARQQLLSVCNMLGVPTAERDTVDVQTVQGTAVGPTGPLPSHARERLVTMLRRVNGVPVWQSMARLAVSNVGQPARLLVSWPRFIVPTGLVLQPRPAVLDAIASKVRDSEFGAAVEMHIHIVYARFGSAYLPAALVGFSDPESGEVLIVPLVTVPGDADLDGAPDMQDNCPERSNPDQEDSDGDSVGNLCDNCPENPNPSQADSDEDGFGDACQEPEGACVLANGCEILTPGLCSLAGGTFMGNGSVCGATDVSLPTTTGPRTGLNLRVSPNPSFAGTAVFFSIDEKSVGPVRVDIYDAAGRLVRTLLSAVVSEPGVQTERWDGRDRKGNAVSAGVYFVRVRAAEREEIRKIALLR